VTQDNEIGMIGAAVITRISYLGLCSISGLQVTAAA